MLDLDETTYCGLTVVTDRRLTKDGPPERVRRSWRERLWSRPWRPWRATRVEIRQVPGDPVVLGGRTILMHPATLARLARMRKDERR